MSSYDEMVRDVVRMVQTPLTPHWEMFERVLNYLALYSKEKNDRGIYITYGGKSGPELALSWYVDFPHGGPEDLEFESITLSELVINSAQGYGPEIEGYLEAIEDSCSEIRKRLQASKPD